MNATPERITDTPSRKIKDLGRKVAFVLMHSDFVYIREVLLPGAEFKSPHAKRHSGESSGRRLADMIKQQAIAEAVGVSSGHWSRMKMGAEPTSDLHLSRLSVYLDVDRYCTIDVWLKSRAVFERTLRTLGFGSLRYLATRPALKDVLASHATIDPDRLRIVVVGGRPTATRGMGVSPDKPPPFPELRVGDTARVVVSPIEGFDHLALLSQSPVGEFVVLAPMAPGAAVRMDSREVILPSVDGAYPVGHPVGMYRLYAIFTAASLELETRLDFSAGYPALSLADESALRSAVAGFGEEGMRVLFLPYEVVR